jgi:hypothetical protein
VPDEDTGRTDEPSRDAPAQQPVDFDPYRYGAPDPHPTHDAFGRPIRPNDPPGGRAPVPPPPPPPYQPYGQYGYPGHARPQTNGMAVAGLVLGILSIPLCLLNVLDVPIVILGITFSAVAMKRARRGASGAGMALTGLICSIIGALLVALIIAIFVPRYSDCHTKYGDDQDKLRTCIVNGG